MSGLDWSVVDLSFFMEWRLHWFGHVGDEGLPKQLYLKSYMEEAALS